VPDAGGALHAPHELYDPRVPELLALLDPATAFPTAAFCGAEGPGGGAGSAGGVLPQLQQLGLRSSADLGTLVLAARFVQHTAEVDGDMNLALARGKVSIM
jgi:sacsin